MFDVFLEVSLKEATWFGENLLQALAQRGLTADQVEQGCPIYHWYQYYDEEMMNFDLGILSKVWPETPENERTLRNAQLFLAHYPGKRC